MTKSIFPPDWNKLTSEKRKSFLNESLNLSNMDLYIVYLDDEEALIEILGNEIEDQGFRSYCSTKPLEVLNFIQKHLSQIALVISDFQMPQMNGFEFRQKVTEISGDIPFVILSGYVDREMALKGVDLNIAAFLDKPMMDGELFKVIDEKSSKRILTIKEDLDLLKGFTEDSFNLIDQVEEHLLSLETNLHDTEIVNKIFGMIHTIKGSSGFFQPKTLHKFAHAMEDTLKKVQSGILPINEKIITVWLQSCDVLRSLLSEFKSGIHLTQNIEEKILVFSEENLLKNEDALSNSRAQVESVVKAPNAEAKTSPEKQNQNSEIKVSMSILDEFMQISGEMTVIRNMLNKSVRNIEKSHAGDKDVSRLSELLDELHKINGSVQDKITDLRKVPVKNIMKPLYRIVRDACNSLGKEVNFKVNGEDLKIDNTIAVALSNSLVHMIRNSIDHGVERPDDREKLGKNRKGTLEISVKVIKEDIIISVIDDGKGINSEAIKNKLIKEGKATEKELSQLSEEQIQLKIFDSGFSTAEKVTDLSGRGVGMSMVKDTIEAMNGDIRIDSKIGKGSQFDLSFPIPKSVLITDCLFVLVRDMQIGIPQEQISRIVLVSDHSNDIIIESLEGARVLRLDNKILPVITLAEALNLPGSKEKHSLAETTKILISKIEDFEFAIIVDEVLDLEDTVVKPLHATTFKNIGFYLGGTFLSDGSVGLIINLEGIVEQLKLTNHGLHIGSKPKEMSVQNEISFTDFVIFELFSPGKFAIPKSKLFRIEEFPLNHVVLNGDVKVTPYRDQILSVIDLQKSLFGTPIEETNPVSCLILQANNKYLGIPVKKIVDLISIQSTVHTGIDKNDLIQGHLILDDEPIALIDIESYLSKELNLIDNQENKILNVGENTKVA